MEVAAKRETKLVETPEFYGWMVQYESQVIRHLNTKTSALLAQVFRPDTYWLIGLLYFFMVDSRDWR